MDRDPHQFDIAATDFQHETCSLSSCILPTSNYNYYQSCRTTKALGKPPYDNDEKRNWEYASIAWAKRAVELPGSEKQDALAKMKRVGRLLPVQRLGSWCANVLAQFPIWSEGTAPPSAHQNKDGTDFNQEGKSPKTILHCLSKITMEQWIEAAFIQRLNLPGRFLPQAIQDLDDNPPQHSCHQQYTSTDLNLLEVGASM